MKIKIILGKEDIYEVIETLNALVEAGFDEVEFSAPVSYPYVTTYGSGSTHILKNNEQG
jgi:hypothetical protein